MVFNATFIRCSVIVWRSVLLAEEIGVPEKTIDLTNQSIKTIQNLIRYNQRKQTISHIKVSSVSGLSILDYCLRFSLSFFTLLYTDTGINAFFIVLVDRFFVAITTIFYFYPKPSKYYYIKTILFNLSIYGVSLYIT